MTNAQLGELDQARIEANDQAMVDQCGALGPDYPKLVELVDRYGFLLLLSELSTLYTSRKPGMNLQWSMVSDAYRNGWFDHCGCSDEF